MWMHSWGWGQENRWLWCCGVVVVSRVLVGVADGLFSLLSNKCWRRVERSAERGRGSWHALRSGQSPDGEHINSPSLLTVTVTRSLSLPLPLPLTALPPTNYSRFLL